MKGSRGVLFLAMATILVGASLAPSSVEAAKVDLQLPRRAGSSSVYTDSGSGGDPTAFTIIAALQMQFSEIYNTVSLCFLRRGDVVDLNMEA